MAEMRWPLDDAAEKHGGRPAVVSASGTISFAELARRVEAAASALEARGYGVRDRIGLLMPNGADYIVWLLAVMRIGGIACPVNQRLPLRTVPGLLERIDCRTLIADDADLVRGDAEDLTVIAPGSVCSVRDRACRGVSSVRVSLDLPATILFTSGSAGPPKAVLHSLGNHYYSARGANVNLSLAAEDRWLLDLPLYHVGGLGIVFRCLLAGACVVIPARTESLETALERYAVTHLSVVVTQLYRLLQRSSAPQPSLRCVVLGGSPVPLNLLERAHAHGLPVFASYGSTEMASQVTTTGYDSTGAQRLTSGKLLPYRELRIAGDGEILVRGKTLFMGYVEGQRLHRPFTEEGWFCTGDFGRVDADGYLTVDGRKDNRFFSGGETIYPEEIERVLCEFGGVDQAVVVPVPHEEFGQRCVAFVRAREGCPPAEALSAWLRETLPKFKVPDAFYPWPENSDPAQLKVDRARFRRLALEKRC